MQISSIQNLFRSKLLINNNDNTFNKKAYNNLQCIKNDSFELRTNFTGRTSIHKMTETDIQEKALRDLQESTENVMLSNDKHESQIASEIYDLLMFDVDATNIDGKNALILAMELKDDEVAALCLQAGYRASDCDNDGRNSLHHAILNNKPNTIKLLLDKYISCALIKQADNKGNTPLHYAIIHKYFGLPELILEKLKFTPFAYNCNVQNKEGLTLSDLARQNGDICLAKYVETLSTKPF